MKDYTEDQKTKFVELAQEIGIGRAISELGYPSWPTGSKWCEQRGVKPTVDTLMQEVKKFHTFYETTDALLIAEEGFAEVQKKLLEGNLNPEELKKVSEAYQKFANTWLALQGKATSITETHSKDATDVELMGLLMAEKARNALKDNEPSTDVT